MTDTCSLHNDLNGKVTKLSGMINRITGGIVVLSAVVTIATGTVLYAASNSAAARSEVQVHKAEGDEFKRAVLEDLQEIKADIKALRNSR
jgi:hypothetical protein